MVAPEVIRTRVGIVGGGPAGLMLSHLLAGAGIDNVVVDNREHKTIRTTHRAGILEHGSVSMLVESGVSDRVITDGHKHKSIDLRFGGESHRIDFTDLVGEAVWLYPQNEVFVDLAAARHRNGGDVRFGVSDTAVSDLTTDTPRISFTDADGVAKGAEEFVGDRDVALTGVAQRRGALAAALVPRPASVIRRKAMLRRSAGLAEPLRATPCLPAVHHVDARREDADQDPAPTTIRCWPAASPGARPGPAA